MGLGFEGARLRGSQVHDEIFPADGTLDPSRDRSLHRSVSYQTNRAGGIEGGVSSGQDIIVRAAMKPLSTLMKPLRSVHLDTGEPVLAHVERSDVCAVPAAAVIGESLLALVLAEAVLEKFGGDSMRELSGRVKLWR